MRHRRWKAGALALGLLVLLAACGDDDDDDSGASATTSGTTAAEGEATAGETLSVKASEPSAGKYAFEGIPETTEAGVYDVAFENPGQEQHELQLVKIEGSHTLEEFEAAVGEEGAPLPDWLVGATGIGALSPGGSSNTSVLLTPGTYLYTCDVTDENDVPHSANGMAGTLTVTGEASGAVPAGDATVKIVDYDFEADGLKAGGQAVRVENNGAQFHHIVGFPIAEGATFEQAKEALLSDDSGGAEEEGASASSTTAAAGASATTEAEGPPPVDFENGFSTAVVGPGEALTTSIDLTAGKYVFLCFISDKAGGPPHAIAHDMVKEVTVT
jgi:plastocyanin